MVRGNARSETQYGVMLFGMTGIQPVNTWVEVEVFFESITDADRQGCEPGIRCGERRRARAGNEAAVESIEDGHNGSQGDDSRRSRGHQRPRSRAIRFARLALELMAAAAPARCGAFVDERRIVVGDGGGRARTRNAHPAQ